MRDNLPATMALLIGGDQKVVARARSGGPMDEEITHRHSLVGASARW
jgi:hypothetical protein